MALLPASDHRSGTVIQTQVAAAIAGTAQILAASEVALEEPEAAAQSAAEQGTDSGGNGHWPDESAEKAFLAEAHDRGEVISPAKAREEIPEETDAKALPPLDELVQRIPAEVREVLDDLFRAKFTKVRRIPAKALKG